MAKHLPHLPARHSPRATARAAERSPERRAEVLQVLRACGEPRTIAEIATALGIHKNTARFHLDNLVLAAQVERTTAQPRGHGRPPQVYRVAAGWDPTGPREYQRLAEALLDHIRTHDAPEASAVDAGYRWGRRLTTEEPTPQSTAHSMRALEELLNRLGFRPDPHRPDDVAADDPQAHQIDLRHCPFQELTKDSDQLVCQLHLGILRGAVDGWCAPLEISALDPEVEPNRCVVRLHGTG